MSIFVTTAILAQIRPTTIVINSQDPAAVVLFSLLGLAVTAAIQSCASAEAIRMMFSPFG